ncbi:MAG: Na/Pi cotransporter family protein [Clostridiales bacterium]|nr:Na/Pi cotransporter family protein [Clostridiales bacterium]
MKMLLTLAGGLGLFLYGMKAMADGLGGISGHKLKNLLSKLTTNRIMGVLVGTFVSAIIQSSSATTVMVVGFVNAGIMDLYQAAGVIMGANIGTTITAQLIAFKLSNIAPIAIFIGIGLIILSDSLVVQRTGKIIAGFGLLFLGLDLMSEAMRPLSFNTTFQSFLIKFRNPIWGLLAGTIMTAIIQSSSASVGILQALAMQNVIGFEGVIYILFGQNIGTCITAYLAGIGANVAAKRAAIIHLIFNILGTALFIFLIMLGLPYVKIVEALTPGDVVRQIANGHTFFNVLNTILLFPMVETLVNISRELVPGKEDDFESEPYLHLDKYIQAYIGYS